MTTSSKTDMSAVTSTGPAYRQMYDEQRACRVKVTEISRTNRPAKNNYYWSFLRLLRSHSFLYVIELLSCDKNLPP